VCLLAAIHAPTAAAIDGSYTIDGGTPGERAQIHLALRASQFDWGVLPPVVVHIVRGGVVSHAAPGEVVLDADLLDAGSFSWGVVQHEFAHEVDFLLLDDADRAQLIALLGGSSWWLTACERFADELAWAYWPAAANVMQPTAPTAAFRLLLGQLLDSSIQQIRPDLVS
jgi:hypothetical protein